MENFNMTTMQTSLMNESSTGNESIKLLTVSSGPILDLFNEKMFMETLLPSFIYTCILLGIGIPGNILVLYVYGFKWIKSTSRIFILALSSFDLVNCLFCLTLELAILVNFLKFDNPLLCRASRGMTSFINNATTVVLVAISIDRYQRICKPHSSPIDVRLAKKVVYFSMLFAVMTSWPLFLMYGTFTIVIKRPDIGVAVFAKTCLISDGYYDTHYPLILVIFLLTCHFASDIMFIVLYTFVGKAVYRQKTTRKSLKGSGRKLPVENSSVTMDVDQEDMKDDKDKVTKQLSQFFKSSQKSNKIRSKNSSKTKSDKNQGNNAPSDILRRQISKSSGGSVKMHAGKTTFMLFLVTVVFIISFLPYCIVVILRYVDHSYYDNLSSVGKAVYQVILRSYFLNSVLNPVVYSFVSQQFRTKAMEAMKCINCRRSSL